MNRTEVDGVPVLWEQGPSPLRATLSFGVGARDETFRTIEVTHLVEHLAMSELPRVHYETNASVDLHTTAFTVCGRPEQVVEFLAAVCRSLGDLPVHRMDTEAGVLAVEGGHHAHPTVEALLHLRLGSRGAGLAVFTGPGYDRLTADHVREHAARFFVAGNAVLHLTGPPPAGLSLPLPPGSRPEHQLPAPLPESGLTYGVGPIAGVGAALLGGRGTGWNLAMSVLTERLERVARHEQGLSYDVDGDAVPLDGSGWLYAVAVDAREGHEAPVVDLVWQEIRRLAADGPTAEELAYERGRVRELFDDPRYVEVDLAQAAEAELFGHPYRPRSQRLAEVVAATTEEVRGLFAAAVPTTQLVVPFDVTVAFPGIRRTGCASRGPQPSGRVFQPPLLAKLVSRHARGRRLILMEDGVAQRDPDGDLHVVTFAEVIGVEQQGTAHTVFGANGCQIEVDPELFPGAEAVLAALTARVPAELCYRRSALLPEDAD